MEWAQSHGGDPLCIVSELPLFLIGKRSPSLEEPVKKNLRNDLDKLRADSPRIDADAIQQIEADYQLTPVPLELQVRLQVSMIVIALYTILDQEIQESQEMQDPQGR
jgi:hypothetical protein